MNTAALLQKAAAKPPQVAPAKPPPTASASVFLQRKCACGSGASGISGECPECNKKKMMGLQTKFRVNEPGDAYEREADRVAEQVLAKPAHPGVGNAPLRIQRFAGQSNAPMHAAPASVGQVLAGPGRPLEPTLRHDMEQRFGHDFSRVRVHCDPAAEQSARDVNAHAYTVGQDIAFAAGQFSPWTPAGQRLIAHELTHVVQQSGAAVGALHLRRKPNGGGGTMGTMPRGGTVREATPGERRDFAREAARFLRGQGEFFATPRTRGPARDLAADLRHLRTTAESGLRAIENDPAATTVADEVREAYREAVRTVLVARTQTQPGSTGTPPTLRELYEEHRDEILPFGLPQATADPAADTLSAELEAPLPARPTAEQRARHAALASARQNLRMLTSAIDISNIDDLFSTAGGTTTIPLPANSTVRMAGAIPSSLNHGLSNVAGELAQSGLTANTTVILALDLTPYGGGYDAYRFTRLDLGTLGTEILIERQGAIGVEGLRSDQRQQLQQRFDRLGFQRGSGFSQDDFDQVLIALGEIPEAQLATLGSLNFARQATHPTDPDAAGNYDQTTHTVTLFDPAFRSSLTRFGRPGRVLKFGAQATVHEVGHALDLAALRTAAAATGAAQAAVLSQFGTGGSGFTIPNRRDPARAQFDVLQGAVTRAETAERAARSRSGARWTMGNPNVVTEALARGARQPEFRRAALADGGGTRQMPTNYPHPDPDAIWQEYFAESFAMYQTSPDLLRRLRPNVFQFMQQQFPRTP